MSDEGTSSTPSISVLHERAQTSKDTEKYEEAIATYKTILLSAKVKSEEDAQLQESSILELGEIYAKKGLAKDLSELLTTMRPYFSTLPNSKTQKIVRELIDLVSRIPDTVNLQIDLCKESIEWTQKEERTFLRHLIETRLAALYLEAKQYTAALNLLKRLLKEVKRFDDKLLLVRINLVESRVQYELKNVPRAKAALTAARTAANAVYCPPFLQAQLDMQAGTLHAEEDDYKTGYSYFYEGFEGFSNIRSSSSKKKDDPAVISGSMKCLKYRLLCKIMLNSPEEVHQIISGKNALKYAGPEMEAMRAVANAHKERSLHAFAEAKEKYTEELLGDSIIGRHIKGLEDTLLEQNLKRIIEPFSRVEMAHIADLIQLPLTDVEKKLSHMILDKKLDGILDQGAGTLIIIDRPEPDRTYPAALETIQNLNGVVDALYEKAQGLRK